ncbi:MAG TPA: hypothetical protein VFK40_08325, partial [Nitrososphaeraceae archaeon]|nr:hypothetical protein [Nitrososphaeraceae archaeon]
KCNRHINLNESPFLIIIATVIYQCLHFFNNNNLYSISSNKFFFDRGFWFITINKQLKFIFHHSCNNY